MSVDPVLGEPLRGEIGGGQHGRERFRRLVAEAHRRVLPLSEAKRLTGFDLFRSQAQAALAAFQFFSSST